MTTIANTIVVESTSVDFAVDVTYSDIAQNTTNTTSVVNTEAHGENRGVVAGLVMSKYTWDAENVRIHPVGRDVSTGRFVSLKDTKEEIIKEAVLQASDLLGTQADYDKDTQLSKSTSKTNTKKEKEIVKTVVEECVYTPEEILAPSVKDVAPVTRIKGSKVLPKVAIPQPMVVPVTVQPHENIVMDESSIPMEAYFNDYMPEYNEDTIYPALDLSDYNMEYEVPPMEEDVKLLVDESTLPLTRVQIIRKVTEVVYRYFKNECTLKSFNEGQIRKQMGFIYRNRLKDLHHEADLVGNIISYLIKKLVSSFTNKNFTYTYSAPFMVTLVKLCKSINEKAQASAV